MKKIMFTNKYRLTEAVLKGRKTMTRRFIPGYDKIPFKEFEKIAHTDYVLSKSRYQVGDIIAVAQSYHELNKQGYISPEGLDHSCESSAGYNNKMFVKAELMPHRIKITDIRIERLQDISDSDCMKEGIIKEYHAPGCRYFYFVPGVYVPGIGVKRVEDVHNTPQEAFASLIDRVSGKGTWDSNPYIFVYSFELLPAQ